MSIRGPIAVLCLLGGAWGMLQPAGAAPRGEIVIVPVRGTVDAGTAALVARAAHDAKAAGARALVLDIDTDGGLLDPVSRIRDAVQNAGVPVDAYVERASSTGALVALAADRVAMAPDASIGAAQPVPATPATVATVRAEFEATAVRHHRDARLAGAMVDPGVDVAAYKAPGTVLSLTAEQARAAGISDATASSLADALVQFGVADAPRAAPSYTPAEQVARVATNPDVSGLLLAIAFLALLVELQTLHLVAGAIGIAALALFFGTHVYAGFSGGAVPALALVGLGLILTELHVVPGHGVAGVLGIVALVAGVLLAFGPSFLVAGLQALAVAIVLSAVAFALLQRVLPENAFVKRLMFAGAQGPDYVASADYRALLGRSGVAVSFLRPAGVAAFDERRVDVLSEGEFVPAGTPVRVTRVEGARVFVRSEVES